MNKARIKEKLIEEIRQVDNIRLLEALYDILKNDGEEEVYVLTEEQNSAIEEAREQYKRGEVFTNEEVDRETEEWLKK